MNPRVMPKLEFFPRLPAGACGHRCSRKRTEEPALESEARPGVLPSGGRAPPAPGTDPGRPRGGGGLSPGRCAEALGAGGPSTAASPCTTRARRFGFAGRPSASLDACARRPDPAPAAGWVSAGPRTPPTHVRCALLPVSPSAASVSTSEVSLPCSAFPVGPETLFLPHWNDVSVFLSQDPFMGKIMWKKRKQI